MYLRDPADLARVQDAVAATALPAERVVYLQGDVCRRELSVELEGVFAAQGSASAAGGRMAGAAAAAGDAG